MYITGSKKKNLFASIYILLVYCEYKTIFFPLIHFFYIFWIYII